jgi:hypothetical protein
MPPQNFAMNLWIYNTVKNFHCLSKGNIFRIAILLLFSSLTLNSGSLPKNDTQHQYEVRAVDLSICKQYVIPITNDMDKIGSSILHILHMHSLPLAILSTSN